MDNEATRSRGIMIALAGVLAVSPDAMLLRWMRSLGASSPDVAVSKYIGIIFIMLALGLHRGTSAALVSPGHFLLSTACQLCYQLAFTFCLLLTDAATALLLISLSPLWAALLGFATMREPLPRRTMLALGLSVCSVGLVFMPRLIGPRLLGPAPDRGPSGDNGLNTHGSLAGDILALFTGLAQAKASAARAYPPPRPRPEWPALSSLERAMPPTWQGASLTVNRHAALHAPRADLTLATALSSIAATVVPLRPALAPPPLSPSPTPSAPLSPSPSP